MKRKFLSILCVIVLSHGMLQSISAQQSKADYYQAGTYEYAGITLPYRQLELNQGQEGSSILVIQLHGGTARGNDNIAQLDASAVDSVENYLRANQLKSIFLLPQCAADRVWNESTKSQTTPMTMVLTHWLQEFIGENDIDQTRIYITGYSAGGSGSWRMLNDNTSMFAAGCIAAANPLMVQVANVAHTPVYAVAGSNDNIMDATKIETFVNSLIEAGGEAQFDLLQGKDHFGTCNEAFTQTRLDWLFSHSRTDSLTDIHQPQINMSQSTKRMIDGQIYITRDDVEYNILGYRVHSNY